MLNSPLLRPLHEYACPLSLEVSQFCYLKRYCFGKDPRYSPHLLQVINPSLFDLVGSFGSTPTKRQSQLGGNTVRSLLQDPRIFLREGIPLPPTICGLSTTPHKMDAQFPLKCLQRQGTQLEGLEILGIFYFFVFLGRFKFSTMKSFIQQMFMVG